MSIDPWLLSAGLILLCGVYVSYEFALVKVPERELERDVENRVPGAVQILGMKRELNTMLAACQFGITLTSLGLTLVLEPGVRHLLEHYESLARYSGLIAMAFGTMFHVTFGELVPKGISLVVPKKVLYMTAPFMRFFRYLSIPFIKTLNATASLMVRLLTGKDPDTDAHQEQSINVREALVYANTTGQLRPEQVTLMRSVIGFSEKTAREVMTPLKEVVVLDITEPWEENLRRMEENGFSRYPVTSGEWHNVIGYVRAAEVLETALKGKRDLRGLIRPIERRPESIPLLGNLNLFQGSPIVALYDETDTWVGILTAEDWIENLTGLEIMDETDDREPAPIEDLADGKISVDGSLLLSDALHKLGLGEADEEEDVDTVGGLVGKRIGRVPRPGDQVELHAYRVTVVSSQGFRIKKLLFEPKSQAEDEAPIMA